MALWVFGLILFRGMKTFYWPDKITLFFGMFGICGFYIFSKVFPQKRGDTAWRALVFELIPYLVFLIALPFNLIIKNVIFTANSFTPINGPLFAPFILIEAAYLLLASKNFIQQLRESTGIQRQRILYMVSGLLFFLCSTLLFDIILPAFGIGQFKMIGPISAIFFTVFSTISIVYYQLLDVRLLIKWIFVNLASLLVVIISFLDFSKYLQINETEAVLGVFAGALLFIFFRYVFSEIYKQLFLKNYRNFYYCLDDLNANLRTEQDPARVINLCDEYLKGALQLAWIYFFDERKQKIISEERSQIPDPKLTVLAKSTREPIFFDTPNVTLTPKAALALLPIYEGENFRGYFLLGPQQSLWGLSYEQLQKLKSTWAHIQTAYSRALLYQNLESKVRVQVRDITYKNQRLKEIIKGQLDFVQMASHQLRTPVTSLSGSLELLTTHKNLPQADKDELISMAYAKVKSLKQLVTGILDLARLGKDTEELALNKVDLKQIFNNILPVLMPVAANKNLYIDIAAQNDFTVLGNQSYLEQAFFNILENAVSNTVSGGIKIYFTEEPQFIITAIGDTGAGIPEAIKNKLFRKHVSANNGVGLGLYMAKAIINAHPQGHVWFESSPQGTTFYVRLRKSHDFSARQGGGFAEITNS